MKPHYLLYMTLYQFFSVIAVKTERHKEVNVHSPTYKLKHSDRHRYYGTIVSKAQC